jgi:glycerophosphoryl diester phosphodiesterase
LNARAGLPRRAWVVAHRGASRDRPENTLAAFDEALEQGCDAIELDLRISADGVPMVFHDDSLDRAGRPGRRLEDLAAAEIQRLDAGASFHSRFHGEPVPALRQVLERYSSRTRLLLELKSSYDEARDLELVRATVRAVREAGAEERSFVLSFHRPLLEATAGLAPRMARVLNVKPPSRLDDRMRAILPTLAALSVDVRGLTPAFGQEVGEAGCPLWAWTCNTARTVDRALEAGAAAVISDRPAWLAAYLEEKVG